MPSPWQLATASISYNAQLAVAILAAAVIFTAAAAFQFVQQAIQYLAAFAWTSRSCCCLAS